MPTTFPISGGVTYTPKGDHRDGTRGKSQWDATFGEPREVALFTNAHASGWAVSRVGWGVQSNGNGKLMEIGVGKDHSTRVFLAKFVDGTGAHTWHGYPVDHKGGSQDRPDGDMLSTWLGARLITKAQMRKIAKGQRCKL